MSLSAAQPIQPNPIYTTSQLGLFLGEKPTEPVVQNAVSDALQALSDRWLSRIKVEHQKGEDGKHILFFTCPTPVGKSDRDNVDAIIKKLAGIHQGIQFSELLRLKEWHA